MKHFTYLFIVVLMFTLATSSIAGEEDNKWEKFSQSLVEMFKSGNDGLKQSAMQRIIQYADKLDVQDAAFDIYNIYRWHKDAKMRQLALVTLYSMKYNWAMKQLVKDLKIEESPALRRQMVFMVNEYFSNKPKNEYNYLATK
jgi:hypothetical protein